MDRLPEGGRWMRARSEDFVSLQPAVDRESEAQSPRRLSRVDVAQQCSSSELPDGAARVA